MVNGMAVSTMNVDFAKFGLSVFSVIDKVLAKIEDSEKSSILFNKMVKKITPVLSIYNRGTKSYDLISGILEEADITIPVEEELLSPLLELDEELKMEL